MADITKTVDIIFGGKSEIGQMISEVEREFKVLERSVMNVATPLAAAGESILKLDAALAAMVVGGLAMSVRAAGEFGGKFGEITTLISATGAPIDAFRTSIIDYSTQSVKSIDQINQAIYSSISASVDYKDSLDFVKEAEKLSVAGRADLGATTVALISTLNAYGESTAQAGKYSDIMFTTVRLGQTTMEALSTQLAKVTGLAANAGVPFETLSAAIAALTVSGLPTEQALTGIKAALTNIIKPTSEAEEMAQKLGLQFNASAMQTKGFEGVLWDAWKATGGNTEQMAKLFGSVEALNAVLILASDKTGKFQYALGEMQKTSGATEAAYKKVADSFENVNQRLANTLNATLIVIGDQLLPQYGQIANSISAMFAGIKIGVDEGSFAPLFKYLDETGKSLAEWFSDLAKAFPEAFRNLDFSGLVNSLQNFGDAIAELFSVDVSDPKALADALQFVVNSLESLINVTTGIGSALSPLLGFAQSAVEGFNSLDASTKTLMGNLMGLSIAFKAFGPTAAMIMYALGSDTDDATRVIRIAFTSIENGMNALKVAGLALALAIATAMQGVAEAMDYIPFYDASEGIQRTSERVSILSALLDGAQTDLAVSSEKVRDAFSGADVEANKFKTTVETTPRKVDTTAMFIPKIDELASEETRWKIYEAFLNKDKNKLILYTSIAEMEAQAARRKLQEIIPEKQIVDVEVVADDDSVEITRDVIMKTFPDGQLLITNIGTKAREDMLSETKKKIDEAVPAQKQMEIQATIDVAKIKAAAEIVQSSIEWKAKLDIADVEANAKIIEAAFKSIDNTITSAGTTLTGMLGTWAQVMSAQMGGTSFIEQQIREENARRDRALDMQEKLTIAEVDNIKARTDAIKRGDAMIQIDGAGLQPHLEAFMFEILAAIQVRANAEGQKFLVGV